MSDKFYEIQTNEILAREAEPCGRQWAVTREDSALAVLGGASEGT